MTTTPQQDADQAYDAGTEWIDKSDRFEKLDYIMETASIELRDNFINEIVQWMSDEDFSEFFKHLRKNWGFKTPQELDHAMNNWYHYCYEKETPSYQSDRTHGGRVLHR